MQWLPALATSGGLVLLLAGAAPFLYKLLEQAARAGFEAQLESIRAEFRREEERLRAELRTRDGDIAAIRQGALSALSSRQAAHDARRLQAVERVWQAVCERSQLKMLCIWCQSVKMDRLLPTAAGGGPDSDSTARFAESILKAVGLEKPPAVPFSNPQSERPFLSPVIWATFTAYLAVVLARYVQLNLAKEKLDPKFLKGPHETIEMVKRMLPHQAAFLDQYGESGLNFLVDEIEEKLLKEIGAYLNGDEADLRSVAQANEITRMADGLMAGRSRAEVPAVLQASARQVKAESGSQAAETSV